MTTAISPPPDWADFMTRMAPTHERRLDGTASRLCVRITTLQGRTFLDLNAVERLMGCPAGTGTWIEDTGGRLVLHMGARSWLLIPLRATRRPKARHA